VGAAGPSAAAAATVASDSFEEEEDAPPDRRGTKAPSVHKVPGGDCPIQEHHDQSSEVRNDRDREDAPWVIHALLVQRDHVRLPASHRTAPSVHAADADGVVLSLDVLGAEVAAFEG
jgi:hypothetical protein